MNFGWQQLVAKRAFWFLSYTILCIKFFLEYLINSLSSNPWKNQMPHAIRWTILQCFCILLDCWIKYVELVTFKIAFKPLVVLLLWREEICTPSGTQSIRNKEIKSLPPCSCTIFTNWCSSTFLDEGSPDCSTGQPEPQCLCLFLWRNTYIIIWIFLCSWKQYICCGFHLTLWDFLFKVQLIYSENKQKIYVVLLCLKVWKAEPGLSLIFLTGHYWLDPELILLKRTDTSLLSEVLEKQNVQIPLPSFHPNTSR